MASGLREYLRQSLSNSSGSRPLPYSEISKTAIEEQLVNLQEVGRVIRLLSAGHQTRQCRRPHALCLA